MIDSAATLGVADDGRFWILFKDFFQYFYRITINYTRDDYHFAHYADEIKDEKWGVARIILP